MRFHVGNFNVYVADNYEVMSGIGAHIMASQILSKPSPVLGLATGSTPIGLYSRLIDLHIKGILDFSSVTTFNLDEYYPIKRANHQSYHYFMYDHLFSHINIPPQNVNVPNGESADIAEECTSYENRIKASGGIDMQLLGIGRNGHIAFNEPSSAYDGATHCVNLTQDTIEANARFFDDISEVPAKAISMGIGTIMSAKRILMLATGENKAEAVKAMLFGEITPQMPASALRFHQSVDVIITKDIGDLIGIWNIKVN